MNTTLHYVQDPVFERAGYDPKWGPSLRVKHHPPYHADTIAPLADATAPLALDLGAGIALTLDDTRAFGRFAQALLDEERDQYDAEPTCTICDAIGHGYGGSPCPLEG